MPRFNVNDLVTHTMEPEEHGTGMVIEVYDDGDSYEVRWEDESGEVWYEENSDDELE